MNILFLSQVLSYPLDAGPKVRSYYVLKYLSRKHTITLVSFVRGSDTPQAVDHLRQFCKEVVTVPMPRARWRDALALGRSLVSGVPFLIARDRVTAMDEALHHLIREQPFDAIHSDQLWMAPYALRAGRLAALAGMEPYLILDQHNAVYLIPQRLSEDAGNAIIRLGYAREARLMARYETNVCQQFDRVVWVTRQDWEAVRQLHLKHPEMGRIPAPPSVIPICVDPGVSPGDIPLGDRQGILFLGGMHWPPNADGARWFTDEIFPLVRAQQAGVKFLAVGKNPPASFRGEESIEAPGYVDDPQPYWDRAKVFIVPLRAGGGMRVKILDAWARGLPVVSTHVGAEGINYMDGENILIADTTEDFARAIVSLFDDPLLARRIGKGGRTAVEQSYNWQKIYPAWDDLYDCRC